MTDYGELAAQLRRRADERWARLYEHDVVLRAAADAIDAQGRRVAEAENRAGEIEWRYDRLAADYGRKCERLAEAETAIQHAANALHGYGVEDQGEAFDIAARVLDTFLNREKP